MARDSNTETRKDCDVCGSTMRLHVSETAVHVPGNPTPKMQAVREWVCPDCDNFVDAEED